MSEFKHNSEENYIEIIQRLVKCVVILLLIIVALIVLNIMDWSHVKKKKVYDVPAQEQTPTTQVLSDSGLAAAPDTTEIEKTANREEIRYGRELVMHTARYLGPKGKVMQISNGMNCQNCHLEAGTRAFGNNYLAVAATYPKFRERSGTIETIQKRVNDCMERSLNGNALDTAGREMQAMVAYILWLGKNLEKGKKPKGSGITELHYLDRAADPLKGELVYNKECKRCHGADGQGQISVDGSEYLYPPLWGPHSYNTGAGLYRLSRFAGYVRCNMPQGVTYKNATLTEEQAWDVAAFVNSKPRPAKDLSKDWPKMETKPLDHPFGPYADGFSETQHKYGPFQPIASARKKETIKQ